MEMMMKTNFTRYLSVNSIRYLVNFMREVSVGGMTLLNTITLIGPFVSFLQDSLDCNSIASVLKVKCTILLKRIALHLFISTYN